MKISSLQKASGNLIKVGDYIYNHVTDGTIGKVTEVRVDEAELYVSLSNGEIVKRRTPNRIDIFVTLVAPAYIDKTGHYLEDYIFICSNKELNCYTQNLDFIGVVQTVDEIRESNLGKDTLLEGTPIAPEGAETSNSANAKSEESVNNSVNELN